LAVDMNIVSAVEFIDGLSLVIILISSHVYALNSFAQMSMS